MMQPILVRSRYAANFSSAARSFSIPVEQHLRRSELNGELLENGDEMIAAHQMFKFIGGLAKSSGKTDLAFDAAKLMPVQQHGEMAKIFSHGTLFERLRAFCLSASHEFTADVFGLQLTNHGFAFYRSKIFGDTEEIRQTELYIFYMMLSTIRQLIGNEWFPRRAYFQSLCEKEINANFEIGNCCAFFGQDHTAIFLSNEDLARGNIIYGPFERYHAAGVAKMQMTDFVTQIVRNHLTDRRLSLKLLARVSGFHERNIQRRLRAEQSSFNEILKEQRVRAAGEMLHDQSMPLAEIARSLGYSNQAHFSRAFRSAVGMTPSVFRRTVCRPL